MFYLEDSSRNLSKFQDDFIFVLNSCLSFLTSRNKHGCPVKKEIKVSKSSSTEKKFAIQDFSSLGAKLQVDN